MLDKFRAESLKSNQSIWFGHYTTSTVVSPSPGVRDVMRWEWNIEHNGCNELNLSIQTFLVACKLLTQFMTQS